jgi:hypothetical protein
MEYLFCHFVIASYKMCKVKRVTQILGWVVSAKQRKEVSHDFSSEESPFPKDSCRFLSEISDAAPYFPCFFSTLGATPSYSGKFKRNQEIISIRDHDSFLGYGAM